MFPDHVAKETKDRIELVENNPLFALSIVIFNVFLVLFGIYYATSDSLFFGLFIAVVGGFFIWTGLKDLLVDVTVIIDKGTKSVRIIKDSNIKEYSSVSELHFSDIQEVKTDCIASEDSISLYVDLITQGQTITIYSGFYESETEELAEKIRKMVVIG